MTEPKILTLDKSWKARLGLEDRGPGELFEASEAVVGTPHAGAIRAALDGMGLSAIFCVQGVPTAALLQVEKYDRDQTIRVHGALWNQGLASLLLVIAPDAIRAFSLARTPFRDLGPEFDKRCLIETLTGAAHALHFRDIITGVESGRYWRDHEDYFKPKERIDQVLLKNMVEAHRLLREAGLSLDAAQALIIQAMFIAYLEDRQIIGQDYFEAATKGAAGSFESLLATQNVQFLKALFRNLRDDFNGDLFVAPCSFEPKGPTPTVTPAHLSIIARFRSGREEMGAAGSQFRFWGYDFRFIPVELISAVYDRFLGEQEEVRREHGAYYTPMFLADTVISQIWDVMPAAVKERGEFLDPACGSGVFLVRSFQRLCENWRSTRTQRTIRWDSLLAILSRLHGWDLNGGAVRVAVFSLYVALLEEVAPPDIRQLVKRGKILPELWGKTLVQQNFFDVSEGTDKFDVIIGNPPWTSRRGAARQSVKWCNANDVPMPGGEDAWAFVWKSPRHLSDQGLIAFLLPAMGFLHNHADKSVDARRRLISDVRLRRVVNFADLRFQLFEGALQPTALLVYSKNATPAIPYRFDYWAPKSDLNLQIKRLITLSTADILVMDSSVASKDPLAFKRRLWLREPDSKLFDYLSRLPKIGSIVDDYGTLSRKRQESIGRWVIGQGFQPFNRDLQKDSNAKGLLSQFVGKLPYLPVQSLQRFAQSNVGLSPWDSRRVRRRGFEDGYTGARVLVPRGVETSTMRLRAAYLDTPLTFQHIIQAIKLPAGSESRGKLLTALLNSKVALWFAFHGTASFGSGRPEVQQAELLHLPFPDVGDLPDQKRAKSAKQKIIALMDRAIASAKQPFTLGDPFADLLPKIDELAFDYFCLSQDEIYIVEDTVSKIIPAIQPHQGAFPDLWRGPSVQDRQLYAETLATSLRDWFDERSGFNITLEAKTADVAVIRLHLTTAKEEKRYAEKDNGSIEEALTALSRQLGRPMATNFQLIPDFRAFVGKDLFLVKPLQQRFWLRSAALADADAIAMDLQDVLEIERGRA